MKHRLHFTAVTEQVYILTFRTYGTWLHGDPRGSVDRANREYAEPLLARDDGLFRRRAKAMKHAPFVLDTSHRRTVVHEAIRSTCALRGWNLMALNVRTNHVHAVVTANVAKERVLADLKAWATRALRSAGVTHDDTPVWSHHGSTRVLRSEAAIEAAIQYVLFEQGQALG